MVRWQSPIRLMNLNGCEDPLMTLHGATNSRRGDSQIVGINFSSGYVMVETREPSSPPLLSRFHFLNRLLPTKRAS